MARVVFRPRVSHRVPSRTWFAELATAPGPQVIGVTGDNRFETLFGREWLLEWSVEDGMLRLYQESLTNQGEWERVDSPLPPVFDSPLPATARRVSFAFDQSARMVVAYEDEGVVKVTRWDASANQYVQNVSFAGVDPQLFMDATLADPAGFPEDVRAAAQAGMRVIFEWLPDGSWRESAISDSDVLIFYLSTDRTKLMARAQRQLYVTEHEIHDFGEEVILDRVVTVGGRYMALVSDSSGAPRPNVILSDAYIGDVVLTASATEPLIATVEPEGVRVENDTHLEVSTEVVASAVAPEDVVVVGNTYPATGEEGIEAAVAPEDVEVVGNTYPATGEEDVVSSVTPEDVVPVVTLDSPVSSDDSLIGGISVENIRVQTA